MYEKLISKLKQVRVYDIIDDYMLDNETKILNLVRERLKRGDGVNGGIIGEYASLSYSYFKQSRNPLAGGYVDLYLTGALQKELEIRQEAQGKYLIHSTDKKYFNLAEKYGKEQFGLTEEQQKQVKEEAIKEVINQISKCYE